MSNKYLDLAKQLKLNQSKIKRIRLGFQPFYSWDLLPTASEQYDHTYDVNGKFIGNDIDEMTAVARKNKKKKPAKQEPFYTVTYKEFNFLAFELSYQVVKRVA